MSITPLTHLTKSHQDRNRREAAKIIVRIERNLLIRKLTTRSTPAKALGGAGIHNLYNNGIGVLTTPIHSRIITISPTTPTAKG